jgi:formylmethanofuran dehydrogenase subunit E
MAKRANHLHRYRRVYLGTNGYKVYKCIQPGCTHYTPVHLVEGALCECNRCGEAMIMDKAAMQLAKPHCRSCTKVKHKQEIKNIEAFLEQI